MGGSGGGFFSSRITPEELRRRTREAEDNTERASFDTEVDTFLGSELAEYNSRDVEGTKEIFERIKEDIEGDIEGTVDLLYGGSISKHTYVDGLSDVDALVLLDRSELRGRPPKELQEVLADHLRGSYGRAAVVVGALAVTLTRDEKSIQLLPALREDDKFKISSADGQRWALIDPSAFATALTRANKAMNGKLVPCIKLAKGIIGNLPPRRQLTGYHTEAIAIQVFHNYDGSRNPKAMLRHFFETAPQFVTDPIKDASGQSIHVDEYLGRENSLNTSYRCRFARSDRQKNS